MDHLGVKCPVFYNLQERACAEMALENDVEDALQMFLNPSVLSLTALPGPIQQQRTRCSLKPQNGEAKLDYLRNMVRL